MAAANANSESSCGFQGCHVPHQRYLLWFVLLPNLRRPLVSLSTSSSDSSSSSLLQGCHIFFGLFFSVAYFLLHRWREKVRTLTPLHVVTISEIAAIVSLIASVIYLLGFFGFSFVQPISPRAPSDDELELEDDDTIVTKDYMCK